MTKTGRALSGVAAAACLAGGLAGTPASAQPQGPHQVKYTVTSQSPVDSQIWYMETEPVDFSAYSWDPWHYVNSVRVDVKPDAPWVWEYTLYDPEQWAMVTASAHAPPNPKFHCELTIDGVVVVSKDGDHGVLCSPRPW